MDGYEGSCRSTYEEGVVSITVPQYWPQHGHPSDYFRFTRNGVIALCESNNLKVMKCWSMGGPFLVLYHVIELNFRLNQGFIRKVVIANLLSLVLNGFDSFFFHHQDNRNINDSVGWACIARKQH